MCERRITMNWVKSFKYLRDNDMEKLYEFSVHL